MLNSCIRLWRETEYDSCPKYREYLTGEQKNAERQLWDILNKIIAMISGFKINSPSADARWGMEIKQLLLRAGAALSIEEQCLSLIFKGGFFELTRDFIREAKRFDGQIGLSELIQALRNVWVMGCIQLSAGKKVELTPAVFSYSLLYPYTDNFMDSSEACAMFSLGAFLQMADDLQDVKRDRKSGICTMFTQKPEQITATIKRDCYLILLVNMAQNRRLFSKSFRGKYNMIRM
jgi:hypothetical protein